MRLVSIPANPAPAGARVMRVVARDGAPLRVALWPARVPEPRGTVLILQGRAEFIEKYFETVEELLARGFCVVAFDWRGQGGSERTLSDPRKGHIARFGLYARDLEALAAQVLAREAPRPHLGLAHSMGAAIALDLARRGRLPLERLVALSPMLGIVRVTRPRLARAATLAATLVGLGRSYVPGGGETAQVTRPFAGNPLSSDPRRYARNADTAAALGDGAIGAPTIGWVRGALGLMRRLAEPRAALEIRIPVLVIAGGADVVVSTPVTERFAARLKTGNALVVPGARHELLSETDAIRTPVMGAVTAFLEGASEGAGAGRRAGAVFLGGPLDRLAAGDAVGAELVGADLAEGSDAPPPAVFGGGTAGVGPGTETTVMPSAIVAPLFARAESSEGAEAPSGAASATASVSESASPPRAHGGTIGGSADGGVHKPRGPAPVTAAGADLMDAVVPGTQEGARSEARAAGMAGADIVRLGIAGTASVDVLASDPPADGAGAPAAPRVASPGQTMTYGASTGAAVPPNGNPSGQDAGNTDAAGVPRRAAPGADGAEPVAAAMVETREVSRVGAVGPAGEAMEAVGASTAGAASPGPTGPPDAVALPAERAHAPVADQPAALVGSIAGAESPPPAVSPAMPSTPYAPSGLADRVPAGTRLGTGLGTGGGLPRAATPDLTAFRLPRATITPFTDEVPAARAVDSRSDGDELEHGDAAEDATVAGELPGIDHAGTDPRPRVGGRAGDIAEDVASEALGDVGKDTAGDVAGEAAGDAAEDDAGEAAGDVVGDTAQIGARDGSSDAASTPARDLTAAKPDSDMPDGDGAQSGPTTPVR